MSRNTITTEAEIDVDSVLPELLTYYEPSDFVDIIIEAAQDKTPRYTEESRRRFTLLQSGELVKKNGRPIQTRSQRKRTKGRLRLHNRNTKHRRNNTNRSHKRNTNILARRKRRPGRKQQETNNGATINDR